MGGGLGHVQAIRGRGKQAIAAYKAALAIEDSYRFDSELHANLVVLMNNRRFFAEAATLLVKELGDTEQNATILARTIDEKSMKWRHVALPVAEELGLGDMVDRRRLYELDLEQGPRCAQRKKAVAKLRALGDPTAIPALEKARLKRGKRGKWRRRNLNKCLVPDVDNAVQYLKTLAADETP